jgi:hypothetical protein
VNVVSMAVCPFVSRLHIVTSVIKLGTKNMRSECERFNDFQSKPPCHNPRDEAYGTCRTGTIASYLRNVERYVLTNLNFYGVRDTV